MTKATKKIERKMRKAKKKQAERDMKEKIGMFSQLEDFCLVCEKVFDKQDKKMVQSWYVVVNKEQKRLGQGMFPVVKSVEEFYVYTNTTKDSQHKIDIHG